jgi:hypothetical protein
MLVNRVCKFKEPGSSGRSAGTGGAFDGRFFDGNFAEDFLEKVTAFGQRPFRQEQIATTPQSKRDTLPLEGQIHRLYAIVVLAIRRVGNPQDGGQRRNQISLFW